MGLSFLATSAVDFFSSQEICHGYLAPDGFAKELKSELKGPIFECDHLLICPGEVQRVSWIQNIFFDLKLQKIQSIKDGANVLRGIQRNWAHYSFLEHRRAQLLQEALPKISNKPIDFLSPLPKAPMGGWTLLERDLMAYSPKCLSPFPMGEIHFKEDKINPPSRAYLKLWELFTSKEFSPKAGEVCLDLGASPGGWTWVLAQLKTQVLSVDKAELDPRLMSQPNVKFIKESAFGLRPETFQPVDWLFSDIICYPDRLLKLVENWLGSGKVKNLVCTIKFQGETDHQVLNEFLKIPGSEACHLFHNKHELMFFVLDQKLRSE